MRKRSYKGFFKPKNIYKYSGDPTKIIYRSLLERRYMVQFDEDESVVKWSSEDTVVPYRSAVDGRMHRYFVDFTVTKKEKGIEQTYLIEIKPSVELNPPKEPKTKRVTKRLLEERITYVINRCKWQAAEDYANRRGWKFIILTEKNNK